MPDVRIIGLRGSVVYSLIIFLLSSCLSVQGMEESITRKVGVAAEECFTASLPRPGCFITHSDGHLMMIRNWSIYCSHDGGRTWSGKQPFEPPEYNDELGMDAVISPTMRERRGFEVNAKSTSGRTKASAACGPWTNPAWSNLATTAFCYSVEQRSVESIKHEARMAGVAGHCRSPRSLPVPIPLAASHVCPLPAIFYVSGTRSRRRRSRRVSGAAGSARPFPKMTEKHGNISKSSIAWGWSPLVASPRPNPGWFALPTMWARCPAVTALSTIRISAFTEMMFL